MILFFLWAPRAWGLNEIFELYSPVQAVAQGYALTSNASGYLANYYNPAGLAKAPRRRSEVTPLDVEGNLSLAGISSGISSRSFGMYELIPDAQNSPGTYTQFSFSSVPGFSTRGFGFSPFFNYRHAAESDGTNIDIDSVVDLGATIGAGFSLFGSRLKLGFAGKVLDRQQIKGNFAHTAVADMASIDSNTKEGLGYGGDVGAIFVIPSKYLPTFGFVWQDIMGTRFTASNILNTAASAGVPDTIAQSFHLGFSLQPRLARRMKGTFSIDLRHIERTDLAWYKKLHFGVQLEDTRNWYYWIGLNRLWPGLGMGMRMPGGNLEIAAYGEEIGAPGASRFSPRFSFRYTIGY